MTREYALEWTSAALLALATVGSAWSAWQAARWGGVQAVNFGRANALRTQAVKAEGRADTETAVDVQVFLDWVDAVRTRDEELAAFLRQRMRDEFDPALDAWLRHRKVPGTIPDGTPFEEPSYLLASRAEAEGFDRASAAAADVARRANQVANNFVFAVVFFAATLALTGMSGKFAGWAARVSVVVLAGFSCAA